MQNQVDRKRLWWIASYPKSGSTWIRMFINAYVTGFPLDINSAWQYALGDLQPHTYQMTSAEPITSLGDVDQIYYRPAVLLNHVLTSNSVDKALKTHHAKVSIDGIPLIPPRLSKGALYILRDPRDVVISFADHLDVSIDHAIGLLNNDQTTLDRKNNSLAHILLSWTSHVNSWTTCNHDVPYKAVRYEDLLMKPKKTWKQVLKALGLEFRQDRFEFASKETSFDILSKKEEKDGFREVGRGDKFFRVGQLGQWKNTLTPQQISKIEDFNGETMKRFGYILHQDDRRNILQRVKSVASATVQ